MVWQRFKDAPQNYPHIPALLRQAKPQLTKLPQRTQLTFFDDTVVEAWPQDNEHREGVLRQALLDLAHKPTDQIQTELERLEQQHGTAANGSGLSWDKLRWQLRLNICALWPVIFPELCQNKARCKT